MRSTGLAFTRGRASAPSARASAALVACVLLASLALPSWGQAPSGPASSAGPETRTLRVEQVLDRPVSVVLPAGTPLEKALATVTQGSGLRIGMAPGTSSYLPDGLSTTVEGQLKNVPMRLGLRAILRPLGLQFRVSERDVDVLILPSPMLERMGRRLRWQEADVLRALAGSPWDSEAVQALRRKYDTADEPLPASRFSAAVLESEGDTLDRLDAACEKLGWVWRLDEDALLLTSKEVQYRRNLELREVQADYRQTSLAKVIEYLAEQAKVPLTLEPGVYSRLSPQVLERFTITFRGASVRDAFDRIGAFTGLEFAVTNDGLQVRAGPTLRGDAPAPTAAPPAEDPVLAIVNLPVVEGLEVRLLLRRGDLSPQAAEALEAAKRKAVADLEAQLLAPPKP